MCLNRSTRNVIIISVVIKWLSSVVDDNSENYTHNTHWRPFAGRPTVKQLART